VYKSELWHLHVIALIRLADGDNRHEVTVGFRQVGHEVLHVGHRVVGRPVHAMTCLTSRKKIRPD
jgi:hypothetical protein